MAHILFVEENQNRAQNVQLMLEFAEHAVDIVPDARLAIEFLDHGLLPDIIIGKVIMAGMDGLQLCRHVKSNQLWEHLPVMLLAEAHHGQGIQKLAQRAGACAVLFHPLQRDLFLAEIDRGIISAQMQTNPYRNANPFDDPKFLGVYNQWLSDQLYQSTYNLNRTSIQRDLGDAHIAAINSVSSVLGENLDLHKTQVRIVEKLAQLLRANVAALFIRDGERFTLGHIAGFGIPTPHVYRSHDSESLAPIWQITGNIGALLFDTDNSVADIHELFGLDVAVQSILLSPLVARGDVTGFVFLGRMGKQDKFTSRDAEIVFSVASVAGLGLRGAQLFHELENAYEDLQELDKRRREFVAITSHELRTPIAIMLGYASLLIDMEENPDKRTQLETIEKQANFLTSMVDALLNLHELTESNQPIQLRCQRFDLQSFLDQAMQVTQRNNNYSKVVNIELQCDPISLVGDEIRLMLAFNNLIDNAIKFSDEGNSISIHAIPHPHGGAVITVTNSGKYIPLEHHEKIFEAFYQVEPAITRSYGGMGLGLAIVKAVVQIHGGMITVESHPQGNTSFIVNLPAKPPDGYCQGMF